MSTAFIPQYGLASGTEASGDIHEAGDPTMARVGAVGGRSYPNRSDLRSPATKPIRMPSDARHPAIQDSARPPAPPNYHQLPSVSPGQIPSPPAAIIPGSGGGGAPMGATPLARFGQAMQAAQASPVGGAPQPLTAASGKPGEHVMTGAPVGPGAGPGILGVLPGQGGDPHAVLNALQSRYSDPDLGALLKSPTPDNTTGIPIGTPLGGGA